MVGWHPHEFSVTAGHTDPREVRYAVGARFFFTRLAKLAAAA